MSSAGAALRLPPRMLAPSSTLTRPSIAPPRTWVGVLLAWTLFGVVHAAVWTASATDPARAVRWTVPTALAIAWAWAVLTPLVFRLTRHVAPSRVGWGVSIAAHAIAAVTCAAFMTWWRRLAMSQLAGWTPEPYLPTFFYWIDVWLFVYASLVVAGHALALRRRVVDRTVRAHLLEAQLARAQLQFLELQLQPHFLFNALNAIQELAHEAPHAAECMLRRLHALLAISLERSGRDEVTLGEELLALEAYVDIQRTRFSEWLTVHIAISPSLRSALVPHLILQPLVENAIRHGLSVRQGPGTVVVTAERRGERLLLRVEDDGIGLRPVPSDADTRREGIGLRNASDRLRQLYGADHRFELRPAPGGGVRVELDLPYRAGEAVATASAGVASDGPTIEALALDDPATWRTGEFSTLVAGLDGVPNDLEARIGQQAPATPQWQMSGSFRTPAPAAVPLPDAADPVLQSASPLGMRAWLFIVALWMALAVFWTNQMVLYTSAARPDAPYSWLALARLQVATSVIWLALSPAVFALARRFRMDAGTWVQLFPLHVLFALGAGFVHTGAIRLSGLSELPVLSPGNMNPLTGDFFVYFALLAWSHSRDFVRWYRARELEGARLTARIAGSRFQALRVQLRPQFLLATLDLLADLVHRDVPRAERLITRLADTLRLTLELGREATSTLKQELDLLQACVETHGIGIRPGVSLVCTLSPALLARRIPSRLLCTMADDLLAADTLNPSEPLTVHVEAERVADVTRLRLWGEANWEGRASGSHAWWRAKSVAEAAVADAGALVSVTFPDRAAAVLLIADPSRSAGRPDAAERAAAVA